MRLPGVEAETGWPESRTAPTYQDPDMGKQCSRILEFAMHRSTDAKYELTADTSVALAHPRLDFTDVKRH